MSGRNHITLFEILLILLVCGIFGVVLIRPMRIARQTAVVEPMEKSGARTTLRVDRSIQRLEMTRVPANEIRIDQILVLTELRSLNVDHSEIQDDDLKPIADQLDLRELHVVATEITDGSVQHIARLKNLRLLDARATFLSDKGIAGLIGLQKLRIIRLGQTWITDAALDSLAKIPQLRILDIRHGAITDASLPKIAAMKNLESVLLDGSQISSAAAAELRNQRPDLEVSYTDSSYIGRVILRPKKYNNASPGEIRTTRISEEAIWRQLNAMAKCRPQLTHGYLSRVAAKTPSFSNQHLIDLHRCRELRILAMIGASVTDDGWNLIHRNAALSYLDCRGCEINSTVAKQISRLWHLQTLHTDKMTDEGLAALSSRVHSLGLSGSPITDIGLEHINRKNFPRLVSVDVNGCGNVSSEAISKLKKRGIRVTKLHRAI